MNNTGKVVIPATVAYNGITYSVTSIGEYAFRGCSTMDTFIVGTNVASIGKNAFLGCTALTKLISLAANPPTCGENALNNINKWDCTLAIPENTLAKYQAADQWKDFFFIEEKDMSGINTITMDDGSEQEIIATYDINGRETTGLQRGMNIVKLKNDTIKKVMVK